jgi:hypothetical protein
VCEASSTTAVELDRLRFIKNSFNCTEKLKKQEDVAIRKEVREEQAGNANSSTDSVNSGSGPDYQIYIPHGWAPW